MTMTTKRADKVQVGDIIKLGIHVSTVISILPESPRVLLIAIQQKRTNGLPWVYRTPTNNQIQVVEAE